MVDINPRPMCCTACRTDRALYIIRRREDEEWLCEECYRARCRAIAIKEADGTDSAE